MAERKRERTAPAQAKTPATSLPVARVAVDMSLPHLDRIFDYLVTEAQAAECVVGCRVRVRFAGKLVDGFVLERVAESDHGGRLAYLERVVSGESVLAPEIATLARTVADRWAGSFADVLRLAVPPRHATVERQHPDAAGGAPAQPPQPPPPGPLDAYADGAALLRRLYDDAPRSVVTALPGDWPAMLATVVTATLASGRGVVVVVPDHRDVTRVAAAVRTQAGADACVELVADLGPAERYRRFLAVRRGLVRCVVGSRAAVWAPVHDLGSIVVWDDGDDLHAEPRAPYCHTREVAVLRAHQQSAALVLAGHAVTAESAMLVQSGWAGIVEPTQQARTATLPAVRATGDDVGGDAARAARLPTLAWRAIRDALAAGHPALVQVPRAGYQLSLQCMQCRSSARCPTCAGPLARSGTEKAPACRWCGSVAASWTCTVCGANRLRASAVGNTRTAEELGRAFPGAPVRLSGGDQVAASVPDRPAVVVATPGAEPVATGGYAAAVLLDTWALLSRPDLRAGEEALRRWLAAAALVRPASDGGRVVVVAPSELRPVQALLRWRPLWHAERELEDRAALHLPPAARVAALTGAASAVHELLNLTDLPAASEVLGPVPAPVRGGEDGEERIIIRVPRRDGAALAQSLHAAAAVRSARKAAGVARIEIDPATVG